MRKKWMFLGSAVLVSVAVSHWGCEVPPLMAPGSSVAVIANPGFIVANGGVSVITAIVTEPVGTFAPDGSVVLFFTNLGRIDAQGKTVNGVARVNLIADSRSGTATVTAYSSGGDAPPVPNPSASPTTAPGGGGGTGVSTATVIIGSALPATMVITASPPTVRNGGTSTITVNVFDERGNPVAHVPVNFALSGGVTGARLESGGSQRFTDSNGQAFDTLRTAAGFIGRATVTATAAGGVTELVEINVTL